MDQKVEQTLKAALKQFSKISRHDTTDFEADIIKVFSADQPFMDKVAGLDRIFDSDREPEVLREIFFDLLLINFFSEDVKKLEEDYLDSKEWEAIEERTLDRGTELLNLLLYLKECEDEDIDPELSDYLNEFLLVDEDEFQDEHRIYEAVIANQILIESSYDEIARVADTLSSSSELQELFYPVMSFFNEPDPSQEALTTYVKSSRQPAFTLRPKISS